MTSSMLPCVILGAGGHAHSLRCLLSALDWPVLGCVSPTPPLPGFIDDCPWLGCDVMLNDANPDEFVLVNGLGSVGSTIKRRKLYNFAKDRGFSFPTLIHPSAIITQVKFDEGVQVMAGVILQAGTSVRENVLLNTGSIIDHNCKIGAHSHLSPGVTLSGDVKVGSSVHIGTGASVMQGISIGDGAIVGAGAVVIRDVASNATVVGNPARSLKKT